MTTLAKNKDMSFPKIRDVYIFAFSHWKNILKTGGILYVLLEILTYLYQIGMSSYGFMMPPTLAMSIGLVASICGIILSIVVPSIVGVLFFRCLLGQRPWPQGFFTFSFGTIERRYIFWIFLFALFVFIVVFCITFLLSMVTYFFDQPIYQTIMAVCAGGLVIFLLVWVGLRLSLIYPALVDGVAQEFRKSVRASFSAMKGAILRFVGIAFCYVIPLFIATMVITLIPTFIIYFVPDTVGIPLLILVVIIEALIKLFMAAGIYYLSFRFYTLRKAAFVHRLQELK